MSACENYVRNRVFLDQRTRQSIIIPSAQQ